MIESLARNIAGKLGDVLEASSEQKEVYAYSLELLLLAIVNLAVICCFAYIIGTLRSTLAFLAIFAPSRLLGGGVHMSTSFRCLVTSTLIIVGLASISQLNVSNLTLYVMLTGSFILGLYVIERWVPAVTDKNPINDPRIITKHKRYMIVLTIIWSLVCLGLYKTGAMEYLLALILGYVSSLLLMTPWAFTLFKGIDQYLDYLNKGGVDNA